MYKLYLLVILIVSPVLAKEPWAVNDSIEAKENTVEQQAEIKKQKISQWEQNQKNKIRTEAATNNKRLWNKHQQNRLKREANKNNL